MIIRNTKKIVVMITEHFNKYEKLKPWTFCWRITLEGFLVSFVIAMLLIATGVIFGLIDPNETQESFTVDNQQGDYFYLFFSMVVIAPIVETLLLQSLPVFVMRLFSASGKWQIIVSGMVFALPHFWLGLVAGISAGIVGGFYFAFTYVHWRNYSRWQAFWITSVGHGIHNLIAFLGIVSMELLLTL